MTARRERKTILCVFLFFLKNRVERGRGGKKTREKKVGRKRTCRGRAGERGGGGKRLEKERERERRIQNDAFEGDQ